MTDKNETASIGIHDVFSIKKEDSRIPLIAHIPHSSTYIPPLFRQSILLNHDDLEQELLLMTDRYTDELFSCVCELGGVCMINNFSRLAFDPERFEDDKKEIMASRGMGVIYEKKSDGKIFRKRPSPDEREKLLEKYYRPYHQTLQKEVEELLLQFGRCLILDCHSFPSRPLPYELDQNTFRPDICLGTDPFHTQEQLTRVIQSFLSDHGLSFMVNRPFAGTYVPLKFYGNDDRVESIMIEVNRKLYMDESTGERLSEFDSVKAICTDLVQFIIQHHFP